MTIPPSTSIPHHNFVCSTTLAMLHQMLSYNIYQMKTKIKRCPVLAGYRDLPWKWKPAEIQYNICCDHSLEKPLRGASNKYPQHILSCNTLHHNLFTKLLLGSKAETVLLKQPCYNPNKNVYSLYRKMNFMVIFSI